MKKKLTKKMIIRYINMFYPNDIIVDFHFWKNGEYCSIITVSVNHIPYRYCFCSEDIKNNHSLGCEYLVDCSSVHLLVDCCCCE